MKRQRMLLTCFSLLLSLFLLTGSLGVTAFADGENPAQEQEITATEELTAELTAAPTPAPEPTLEPSPEPTPEPLPEPSPEPIPEATPEIDHPLLWYLDIPDSMALPFGVESVTVSPAVVKSVENLGEHRIYLTIKSNCVFLGEEDYAGVTLCVDGQPIAPEDEVVYGIVSKEGSEYKPITLLFSENAWSSLAAGSYSLCISYSSYAE